jgi:hypothetical protein
MKHCSKCKITKTLSEFHKQTKTKYHYRCKSCQALDSRNYRSKMRKLVGRWKRSKGCKQCGYNKRPEVLQLDHRNPLTKIHKGSHAYKPWWSKVRIKEELSKCDVLCANCHIEKTIDNGDYLVK